MNNSMTKNSAALSQHKSPPDLAAIGLQLLSMAIEILERTEHEIAVCHAQMARDVLVSKIIPDASFVASLARGR